MHSQTPILKGANSSLIGCEDNCLAGLFISIPMPDDMYGLLMSTTRSRIAVMMCAAKDMSAFYFETDKTLSVAFCHEIITTSSSVICQGQRRLILASSGSRVLEGKGGYKCYSWQGRRLKREILVYSEPKVGDLNPLDPPPPGCARADQQASCDAKGTIFNIGKADILKIQQYFI